MESTGYIAYKSNLKLVPSSRKTIPWSVLGMLFMPPGSSLDAGRVVDCCLSCWDEAENVPFQ